MPTNEHDSILSTNRSKWGRPNIDEGGNAELRTSGVKADNPKNQRKYFQKGGRVRSRSNAPIGSLLAYETLVRNTAPGGDRGRHGATHLNTPNQISIMENDGDDRN